MTRTGYKLLRVRKDGTIGSLFINAAARLPLGKWMWARPYHKKGYAFRPGWHVLPRPGAPHLTTKGRRWYKVEVQHYTQLSRPASQGGMWILANRMRILEPA